MGVAFGAVWLVGGVARGFRRATVPLAIGTTGFGGMAASVIAQAAAVSAYNKSLVEIDFLTGRSPI